MQKQKYETIVLAAFVICRLEGWIWHRVDQQIWLRIGFNVCLNAAVEIYVLHKRDMTVRVEEQDIGGDSYL